MAAGIYDFIVEQGIPFTFDIQYQNPDGSGKNLIGWLAKGQIKEKLADCEPLGEFEIEITNPAIGQLRVTLPKTVTENLEFKANKHTDFCSLVYDIVVWSSTNPKDVKRLLNGIIRVSPQVTKLSSEVS